jgi:DnaJ-class molecular chaperone
MRNPYEVLGVDRKASAADIKSAFRRLAKKLHPDANKDDPKAASRFAEINAAYEILGEEDKRKAFDRGEIDAEGKPRFQGFEGFGGGAGPRQGAGFGGGFGPETEFETFNFGPEGFTRGARRGRAGAAAGGGGFEDILR